MALNRPFAHLMLATLFASAGPAWAASGLTPRELLLDLNSRPLSVTKPDERTARVRMLDKSGKFSLAVPRPRGYSPASYWRRRSAAHSSRSAWNLELVHYPEGSWIRAHIGKKSRRGMPGVLSFASTYVRGFIVEYDPDEVISEISLETYRGSVIYCGRIPDTHFRRSCSLAHVVLHGQETLRFYGLIVAYSPSRRDTLLRELASILASLELHEP